MNGNELHHASYNISNVDMRWTSLLLHYFTIVNELLHVTVSCNKCKVLNVVVCILLFKCTENLEWECEVRGGVSVVWSGRVRFGVE